MAEVLFNKAGAPLVVYGKSFFAATKGAPNDPKPKVSKQVEEVDDLTSVENLEVVSWGPNNDFPTTANQTISSVGVLNTGLKFIRNFTIGQGIFPCRITGYNADGSEIIEYIDDPQLVHFCESRMVRRYLEKLGRDYFKYGNGSVQLLPDATGSKMVGINATNALFTRYAKANKAGVIDKAVVSGKFPDNPGKGEYETIDVLDDYDPIGDLNRRRIKGFFKGGRPILFAVRDSWSNAEYYSEPIWYSAFLAGWIDVAQVVPQFLKRAYENQITWKWHVQIPYAFWDKKFPKEDFDTNAQRQDAITQYLDDFEESLVSHENADKAIITFFEINPQSGRAEEQWIITALDNKYKENDKLITSAAANSEILFSLMLNPNVLGAGMPGGTYAGNQGGSNIREAFLVNIANAWIDRQNLLDPLELFLEYNGVQDVQLRFRSTVLTTLDSGAGTKNVQS